MQDLNFPRYDFKVKRDGDKLQIFDRIRKKWILLLPEEWVRQHIVWFLIEEKSYPESLIAIEKNIKVNNLNKRFDIVLFNQHAQPVMIVECKAPNIKITEDTVHQILRYNSVIRAPYLLLSNGLDTFCGQINFSNASFSYIKDVPHYSEIF